MRIRSPGETQSHLPFKTRHCVKKTKNNMWRVVSINISKKLSLAVLIMNYDIQYLWQKEKRICHRPKRHRSLYPALRCSQCLGRNPPTPFVFCRRPYQLYEHRFDGLMELLTPFRCRISVVNKQNVKVELITLF